MIAVLVLSFGLLALGALQANLLRAGAETKARSNATTIAQQVVENSKTFSYLTAPAGYTGATYESLSTGTLGNQTIAGVSYSTCRQVKRFRYNEATSKFVALNGVDAVTCSDTGSVGAVVDASTPEFKEVRATVGWNSEAGIAKVVELTDTVGSIAPANSIQVVKTPFISARGPEIWIEPPNKGNPQVVPIAIGGDQSAASSNPKPEQFIQDVSAVTRFSVQTFTGATSGDEVRLNRKLDVAAVSCVCQNDLGVSSATKPAYQATQWNGKQLAYLEPQAVAAGTRTGTPVASNSAPEIEALCTTCCRDHHESANRIPRPDPYRLLTSGEVNGAEHYGYKKQGSSYVLDTLLPAGSATGSEYVDACQLVRVNGLMRMTVDAQQNHLMVTPLNDNTPPGYLQSDFIARYSGFVSNTIADGMATLPTGYPGPNARFPAPTAARLASYVDIVTPPSIGLVTGDSKKLVAFGLYMDYVNADTIKAYTCAVSRSNTGDCEGLGSRNPLEVLPLYAVNIANLGSWDSSKPAVASVVNATYNNIGLLATDGGTVTAQVGASTTRFPVSVLINNSNSGLAGTSAVDPDDDSLSNLFADLLDFTKAAGTTPPQTNKLFIRVGSSTTLTLSKVAITVTAPGTGCAYAAGTKVTTCGFGSPALSLSVTFATYQGATRAGAVIDRKICVPANSRITSMVSNTGLTSETTTVTLSNLAAVDYTLTVDIIDQATTCPAGTAPLMP